MLWWVVISVVRLRSEVDSSQKVYVQIIDNNRFRVYIIEWNNEECIKLVVVGDKAEIAGILRNATGLSAATQTLSVPHVISARNGHSRG